MVYALPWPQRIWYKKSTPSSDCLTNSTHLAQHQVLIHKMALANVSRVDIMNAQRYDISRRGSCSPGASCSSLDCLQPKRLITTLDPEAVVERLFPELIEAERHKVFDAQRYDPRSKTNSPEPSLCGSDRKTFSESGSSYGSASESLVSSSFSSDIEKACDTSSTELTHLAGTATTSSWSRPGRMVTTRTVIRPVLPATHTPFLTPPTSRPASPKSPRAILRSLNCTVNDPVDVAQDTESRESTSLASASEPLTIFVTQRIDDPLTDEQKEREQLWREAMCSLHFGGDWEQMNKRFPPGQPRW
ncbi:hypothetical protein BDP27DRAFT_1315144 [Rhodocollybia butyracea]|uniref:Uncharacterized protein n=1 Tax=Rhodocollybia butyracea TaxID=206335 RepID=A0A9P5UDT3_9AGAR|nr:hypothetical protein BDP27DRAFT_1315144 [Rhodocollybia butyracea]